MPALQNARHEAFAQAILAGIAGKPTSAAEAYRQAGYKPSTPNATYAASSRLLRIGKGIGDRIRELQHESAERAKHKIDLSRERVGRRLDLASRIAEQQEQASAVVSAEQAIARVFGLEAPKQIEQGKPGDFSNATSQTDIGKQLLQQVGISDPTEDMIAMAVEANSAFIAQLEAIAQQATEAQH